MAYTVDKDGTKLVVRVMGHLDVNTSSDFEKGVKAELDGIEDLTIDMAGVDYVSSSGLRALLALQKSMFKQGTMRLVNVTPLVRDLLDETGFSEIITVA